MSIGINKAGLAPTTLGLTGLESINSSAESQDAREKTSMRTRAVCLNSWEKTLKELFNRWLQVRDYIEKKQVFDYSDLINIRFNEYTNPTLENITDIIAKQVQTGLKSTDTAVKELNEGMSDEQVQEEVMKIMAERGQPVLPPSEEGMEQPQPVSSGGTQRVMLYSLKG
jgi:6-pyruvoyl-tetrahydropterin synthase